MKKTSHQPDCHLCKAVCCRYIAIHIDTPTTQKDWDHIRWYLLHQNVNVFIDHTNSWMIEFITPCKKLTDTNQCGGYETRPKICRNHPHKDDFCEFEDSSPPYKKNFSNIEELDNYLEARKKKYGRKKSPIKKASTKK